MFTPFKCLAKPFFVILCTITVSTGCQTEDTGRCCQVLLSDASSAIPAPEFPGDGGIPRNLVGQHPAFDCESLTCVSWEGSAPFCTRKCNSGRPCPQGFECRAILESDPGMGAGIRPGDTFCVRRNCESDIDCPEAMTCKSAFEGQDPNLVAAKHCVQRENTCN